MKFKEWWQENYPDGAAYDIARISWNAALEQAMLIAKTQVAELQHDSPPVHIASHTTAKNIADKIAALS